MSNTIKNVPAFTPETGTKNDTFLPSHKGLDKRRKKSKYKKGGHFVDLQLKYDYPPDKNKQLNIFDLSEETREDIESAGISTSQVVIGLPLTPSETKLIDCFFKILHETSQTYDPKREDYYSGPAYELVRYGDDERAIAPKLIFTLYNLTKEYKGGAYVTGKDIQNVQTIINSLSSKSFLIKYTEKSKIKGTTNTLVREIEEFTKLIRVIKLRETEYTKDNIELSKKEETIIQLNPIFTRQIDSKYIQYPSDINERTILAYGSHNVSTAALMLRDYLIRLQGSKQLPRKIPLDRFYHILAEKWMKEGRKKKVKEFAEKALETVIALGILISYEIKLDPNKGEIICFNIDDNWE